jgi:glycosyltransferase involved in cell wall biosynthesis
VVPSVWAEPFGIVVIEAMAGGTPVVASNIGGIPEIIDDGVSGVLVKPGDAAALRNALTGLIDNPAARLAMGDAARRRADDFKAEAVVPMLEDVYRGAKTRR